MSKIYPFKFLDSYGIEDKGRFFGRDDEIDALYKMTFTSNIILVYGASGTGKTSLIQCGLLNKFQPHEWMPIMVRRGSDLVRSLEKVLIDNGGDAPVNDLDAGSESATPALLTNAARYLKTISFTNFKPVYLIFDQFEELFILAPKAEQDEFVTVVREILQLEQPVKMIFSLREEYLGYLSGFEKAVPEIMRKKLRVEPMTLEKVQQVVVGFTTTKIRDSMISLKKGEEDAIGEAIFNKVKGMDITQPIQLPYLQVFMDKLYMETTHDKDKKTDAVFAMETVRKMGDIGDILRDFLEDQVKAISAKLSTTDKPVSPEDIWKILSPFATSKGTKEPISLPTLKQRLDTVDAGLIDKTVKEFESSRIIRPEGDHYELAHDALAGKIAAKRTDEDRAFEEAEDMVKNQLSVKEEARAPFTEKQLNLIEPFLKRLNADEKKLVVDSRKKVDADKRKKRQITTAFLVGLTVALTTMTLLAIRAIKNRKLAEQKTIESESLALSSESTLFYIKYNDLTKGFRCAQYAYEKDSTNLDARRALYSVIFRDPDRQKFSFYKYSFEHQGHVCAAVFSGDGKLVLTASEDKTAKIWDAATGKLIDTLVGHTDKLKSGEFSDDGKKALTSSDDGTARIWDVATGKSLVILHASKVGLGCAVFSPDGKVVMTGSRDDSIVKIWNAATGKKIADLVGHGKGIYGGVFSKDSKQLLTASKDHTARLWSAETGDSIRTFRGHGGDVWSAVFSPDGKEIFTAADDNTAKMWDIATGKPLVTYKGHRATVYSPVFSKDGKKMLTTSDDSTVKLWDVASGKLLDSLVCPTNVFMSAIFSPDGKQVLTSSMDRTARIWDAATGQEMAILTGHVNTVGGAIYSSDGKYILTKSDDNTAKIWDASAYSAVTTLAIQTATVTCAVFSDDGKRLLTGSEDDTARIWDVAGGKVLVMMAGHSKRINTAVFSPDGKQVLTASDDNTARIWDAGTGRLLDSLAGHRALVKSAVFSPDGKQVLTASYDSTAKLWDATNGQLIRTFTGHHGNVWTAVFSPDMHKVITAASDKTAMIWDAATAKALDTLIGHVSWVTSACFSPDGKQVLTASFDNNARIWDAATGSQISILIGHTNGVLHAAYSPDGSQVLTASLDNTARLWDVDAAKDFATFAGREDTLLSAVFAPSGHGVLTASRNKVKLSNADIPSIIADLKNKIGDMPEEGKKKFEIKH